MATSGEFNKTVGDIAYQGDYNTIQALVQSVKTGFYGTVTVSSQVPNGEIISAQQWNNLKTDIDYCLSLQSGTSLITTKSSGELITASNINVYKSQADQINNNTVLTGGLLGTNFTDSPIIPAGTFRLNIRMVGGGGGGGGGDDYTAGANGGSGSSMLASFQISSATSQYFRFYAGGGGGPGATQVRGQGAGAAGSSAGAPNVAPAGRGGFAGLVGTSGAGGGGGGASMVLWYPNSASASFVILGAVGGGGGGAGASLGYASPTPNELVSRPSTTNLSLFSSYTVGEIVGGSGQTRSTAQPDGYDHVTNIYFNPAYGSGDMGGGGGGGAGNGPPGGADGFVGNEKSPSYAYRAYSGNAGYQYFNPAYLLSALSSASNTYLLTRGTGGVTRGGAGVPGAVSWRISKNLTDTTAPPNI